VGLRIDESDVRADSGQKRRQDAGATEDGQSVIVFTSGGASPAPTKARNERDAALRLILDVEVGVVFFQVREFGQVVVHDVGLAHVRLEIVLVIFLGAIKSLEGRDLRHDF
jgi:hypothetical protein